MYLKKLLFWSLVLIFLFGYLIIITKKDIRPKRITGSLDTTVTAPVTLIPTPKIIVNILPFEQSSLIDAEIVYTTQDTNGNYSLVQLDLRTKSKKLSKPWTLTDNYRIDITGDGMFVEAVGGPKNSYELVKIDTGKVIYHGDAEGGGPSSASLDYLNDKFGIIQHGVSGNGSVINLVTGQIYDSPASPSYHLFTNLTHSIIAYDIHDPMNNPFEFIPGKEGQTIGFLIFKGNSFDVKKPFAFDNNIQDVPFGWKKESFLFERDKVMYGEYPHSMDVKSQEVFSYNPLENSLVSLCKNSDCDVEEIKKTIDKIPYYSPVNNEVIDTTEQLKTHLPVDWRDHIGDISTFKDGEWILFGHYLGYQSSEILLYNSASNKFYIIDSGSSPRWKAYNPQ